jgi:hypothetical protein
MQATFREESASGRTWWTTSRRQICATDPGSIVERVTCALVEDIASGRVLFERLLGETGQEPTT